ncbi:MAG: DUF3050 domain-containing protein [Verrucomicrobiales bacterium]|nr:DUF3050 domain-containing protein [Verrucomicrobiales bacterium]
MTRERKAKKNPFFDSVSEGVSSSDQARKERPVGKHLVTELDGSSNAVQPEDAPCSVTQLPKPSAGASLFVGIPGTFADVFRYRQSMTISNGTKMNGIQNSLAEAIEPERQVLLEHPLYNRMQSVEDLAVFMEYHVFAVWDFMSLLKALQVRLTCVSIPWLPEGNGEVRRLVNEIVLAEESDFLPAGGASSHFELYLQAMREAGANTSQVNRFTRLLDSGQSVDTALQQAGVPIESVAFVQNTFALIERGRPHEIVAAFTYGREDLIPEMFTQLIHGLDRQFPGKLTTLRYYLERHIELDGDEHGEMGAKMVNLLCEGDPVLQREATQAAVEALQARIRLWNGIASVMDSLEAKEAPV